MASQPEPQHEVQKLHERIVELEIQLTHQQALCDQLNEVVTQQTTQLLQLEKIVPKLQQQLRDVSGQIKDLTPPPPNERPPHY